MAATLSGTLPLALRLHRRRHAHNCSPLTNPKWSLRLSFYPNSNRLTVVFNSSASRSSSSTTLPDPLRTVRFLTSEDLQKLQFLQNYKYFRELKSGYLLIRAMREEETEMTVELLAESFAESMLLPKAYAKFLGFLVKQYLIERRGLMPHTVTLVGFYTEGCEVGVEGDVELAGTVEVSFNKLGANASPPTPTPPKNSPYICNMTVKKSLRRRGIGWHLLEASEDLISQLSTSMEVYLHCRTIDSAPFNMYSKAGYAVVGTDSVFILLTLQRRKHLMRKKLPPVSNGLSDAEVTHCDEENPS